MYLNLLYRASNMAVYRLDGLRDVSSLPKKTLLFPVIGNVSSLARKTSSFACSDELKPKLCSSAVYNCHPASIGTIPGKGFYILAAYLKSQLRSSSVF